MIRFDTSREYGIRRMWIGKHFALGFHRKLTYTPTPWYHLDKYAWFERYNGAWHLRILWFYIGRKQ